MHPHWSLSNRLQVDSNGPLGISLTSAEHWFCYPAQLTCYKIVVSHIIKNRNREINNVSRLYNPIPEDNIISVNPNRPSYKKFFPKGFPKILLYTFPLFQIYPIQSIKCILLLIWIGQYSDIVYQISWMKPQFIDRWSMSSLWLWRKGQ